MKRFLKEDEAPASLDISPLIDVVFILLIFFMVSTTFVKDMQVELQRPGAASSTPANSKSIRVYIDRNNQIFVDGVQVRSWVLQGKVRDLAKASKADSILVVTDKGVPSERLIEVVDQCRLAGVKEIAVATQEEA